MSERLSVIGVDPGPVPGMVLLLFSDGRLLRAEALQCTHRAAPPLMHTLTEMSFRPGRTLIAVERFVVRGRATKDQSITRDQVAGIGQRHPDALLRSASEVKPWATDARLEAAGLLEVCKGMRHARDAARHALFAAVHDGGITDPLSKEFRR